MKCKKCDGTGVIQNVMDNIKWVKIYLPLTERQKEDHVFIDGKMFQIENIPDSVYVPIKEENDKKKCESCDGTGRIIVKGEVGWGNLNDFGQEGEDITNL